MAEAASASGRRLRPGLLDLYLIRGAAGPFVAITLAVGMVMMLERALRLIREMAAAGADISYFLPLLLRLVPYYLDLALPAAFMVALVLLVARLDDRLELEAMLAAGLSLTRIALPLAGVGVLVGLASLVASGWLEPLGRYEYRSLRIEALNAGRIARLHPQAFYHPTENLAVTFDRRGGDGRAGGLFVWQRLPDGRELTLTGRGGLIGFVPRERRFGIDLDEGRYLAQRPGTAGPDLVAFRTMALRESLRLEDSEWRRGWDQNELTLPELAGAARSGDASIPRRALEAEYWSRIARAATVPLIPFLVLPLAFATKKGRRGLGILVGGVVLAAYHHAINFARQLALAGEAEAGPAILGTTLAGALLIGAIFVSGRQLPSHSRIAALLAPLGHALARVRARSATPRGLRGRTLSFYLAWRLAAWTLGAAAAIIALLQMVDLFDRADAFVERGMGLGAIALYCWLKLPALLFQALPVAALAGAMVVFVAFGRSREMVAIRAAGISQYRVLLMALPVPVLAAAASFALAETAVPASQARFAAWWAAGEPAAEREAPPPRWFRIGGEIVRAAPASADGRRLAGVEIFRRDGDGLLIERLTAASADAGPGGWRLHDVRRLRIDGGGAQESRAGHLAWPTRLTPDDVTAFVASAPALSAAAARRALGREAPVSQARALFETQLFRSAAGPVAPLVMLLLALPLAFAAPRTGVAWPALLYAGGGGLLYLVADGVFTVAGQVGALPPMVGAWAAPALFGVGAVTVLVYSER
jgi:lipopolysaccharide export system permease protein